MRQDKITEWEFGEGAIKTIGKFLIQETSGENPIDNKQRMTLICGLIPESLLIKPTKDSHQSYKESCEMWEGEIILIPKRKYTENNEEGFWALKIGQKLLGLWGHAKYWKKQIFNKST